MNTTMLMMSAYDDKGIAMQWYVRRACTSQRNDCRKVPRVTRCCEEQAGYEEEKKNERNEVLRLHLRE